MDELNTGDHDMKRIPITADDALTLILSGKGAILMHEYLHDDWCPTMKTGSGTDCTCEPDEQFFEYVEEH